MKFRAIFVGVALCVSPIAAHADPYIECSQVASNQVEIGACLGDVTTGVDASVDFALGVAMDEATDLDQAMGNKMSASALDASQIAWEAYRDAQCDYVGATYGSGSGAGIAIQSCRITLGRARAEQLMDATN